MTSTLRSACCAVALSILGALAAGNVGAQSREQAAANKAMSDYAREAERSRRQAAIDKSQLDSQRARQQQEIDAARRGDRLRSSQARGAEHGRDSDSGSDFFDAYLERIIEGDGPSGSHDRATAGAAGRTGKAESSDRLLPGAAAGMADAQADMGRALADLRRREGAAARPNGAQGPANASSADGDMARALADLRRRQADAAR